MTRASDCSLTVILILVYPAVALFSFHHEFIIAETCIDESIDKGACEIAPCRINVSGCTGSYKSSIVNSLAIF